ncbi:sugar phosphate isomerase/epimerase family protein [Ligilactobacillus apodemi]|uniref:sugar phosphate isomerase/epimerase family protein n=1 Tax=Ligilactobacillus apodemi TaxID=307126 RepID=UPI00214B6F4C|nr:TIM barrel protein [Ligilactobacillus apodemi]MCR1900606.1 hypothetical protein [Ligilactobacillus apodemi]
MQVSINTAVFLPQLEQHISQLECLQAIDGWPIENIEVRGEFFSLETKIQELTNIKSLCQKNTWNLYYSVPEELFLGDHFNPELEQQLALAEKLEIKNLKYSFGNFELLFSDQEFDKLQTLLNNSPITVTIENQPNSKGELATMLKNLELDQAEKLALGYTFDAGNWYWINENPNEAFQKLHDKINIFHLKDIKDHQTVLLGEGQTDWQPMIKALSPNIPIFLEYGTTDLEELQHEIKLVNHLLAK